MDFMLSEKLSAQLGLRAEQNRGEGEQIDRDTAFVRENIQLFPTAFLAYNPSETHSFGLSYGRRIERPEYESINPYRQYQDEFSFQEGNVNLLPQLTDNVEFNFLGWDGLVSASAYYNNVQGVIMETISQNLETKALITRPENVAQSEVYGASINLDLRPAKFLMTSLYVNGYNSKTSGIINDDNFSLEQPTISGSMINRIRLGGDWSVATLLRYYSKTINGTYLRDPYGEFFFFVQKKLMDNRASLRLSFYDVFNWKENVGVSDFQNIYVSQNEQWQTRFVRLSFSYRFRNGKVSRIKRLESSNTEENSRIKSESLED